MEPYTTGVGQVIYVHDAGTCRGEHCCVHNPSQHHLVAWPTLWRPDRNLMERVCSHGIGHPDPDHIAFLPKDKRRWEGIHGCDGCCIDKGLTASAEGAK